MKKKIDISGAMAAESALARQEAEALENEFNNLPDGELKSAILKEKGKLKGDLAGLPANHPLIKALEESKLRHEQAIETLAEDEARHLEEQEGQRSRPNSPASSGSDHGATGCFVSSVRWDHASSPCH